MADLTGMMQAAAGAAGGGAVDYIEDVFSTYLYTGTGAALTITNDIDLDGEGGLVWIKARSQISFASNNTLIDTVRGNGRQLYSDLNLAQSATITDALTSFNSNGFSLGADASIGTVNLSTQTYCSWTFREQAKFFDVVSYTGTGSNTTILHDLGSVPGMIIVKRTDTTGDWQVYHRANTANPETDYLVLNTTAATADSDTRWNDTLPTSTVFSLGTDATVNASGGTYVAYLFAHDAGGFGTSGTDNVISCGSFTADGGGSATINLGYEPQLVLIKQTNSANDWQMVDVMRGLSQTSTRTLYPNSSSAEVDFGLYCVPTATGFTFPATLSAGASFIYMAIRRPMKVPTTGTSVFSPIISSASTGTKLTTGFPVDMQIIGLRSSVYKKDVNTRLIGVNTTATSSGFPSLFTTNTDAESNDNATQFFDNTGFQMSSGFGGSSTVFWNFSRAPGFMDVVCYTGTGTYTGQNQNHNLGVVPELMIVKSRNQGTGRNWAVYSAALGATKYLSLNLQNAEASGYTFWNDTTPTSSVCTVNGSNETGNTNELYVAYLFATLAGVSKVGSYTGTGSTQTINCGFTGGARFVLIKRTDSSGSWYVWDTARGIVSGDDPYLLLNSTAAEVTNTDYIDPASSGFELSSTAPAAINASGGSFIFLAIA